MQPSLTSPYGANIRTIRYYIVIGQYYGKSVRAMTDVIQPFYLLLITLAGWINRFAHHLTTFNIGCTVSSSKSIVCLNRSFFTNAA
jgi:hypothetical protein